MALEERNRETFEATSTTVACDGGGGALGHPTVYLKIGPSGDIVCPYCSRHFVLKDSAEGAAAH